MSDEPESLNAYIRERFAARVAEALDAAPWWCRVCGEKGNEDGETYGLDYPDWCLPPVEHVCTATSPVLVGIVADPVDPNPFPRFRLWGHNTRPLKRR